MIPLTLAEIATAVDGRLAEADPEVRVTGAVEYDSRKVGPGGLFVAFPGEKVDGHDYAARAIATGAVAVLGTRAVPGVPMILVDDALAAMAALARTVVAWLPELTVIGLTGSSGKTSTKDMVGQLVSRLGPTVAPPGTFNNELGHPWTVLRADEETRYLVLEKSARGIGDIRYLCELAPPRIAVVINVGAAHIGEFGSVDAIAQAKGELVEALPPDGLAVLNVDDPRVRAMASRTGARVVLAGEARDAEVRAEEIRSDERGRHAYTLVTPEGRADVRLGLSGRHQVGNSLLAAAVAREVGMPLDELATALGGLALVSSRRMDVFDRADGVTVIDDSYNANPASMAAALRALAGMGDGRRRVAVLGYMAELGPYERDGHAELGRLAAELDVDRVLVVESAAAPIHDGATSVGNWGGTSVLLTDQAAAIAELRRDTRPGDIILVKGSRYRTWEVADALRSDVPPADAATEGEPA